MSRQAFDEGFAIRKFMVDELLLSGAALLVYALIYSFSSLGKDFYGTKDYIAKRTGTNVATVHRAIATLKKNGLLVSWGKRDGHDLLQAVYPLACGNLPLQNARLNLAKCDSDHCKMRDNNKEIIKNTTTSSSTSAYAQGEDSFVEFLHFGTEGLVVLTEEQHDSLCNLLGDDVAESYIMRLETYIINNPAACLKSHYKTIKKWALEDGGL